MSNNLTEEEIVMFIGQCLQKFAQFPQIALADYLDAAKERYPEDAANFDILYETIMRLK